MIPEQYTRIVVSAIFNHVRQYIVGLQFSDCIYIISHFPSNDFTFNSIEKAEKIMTAFQEHTGMKFEGLLYELFLIKRTEKP